MTFEVQTLTVCDGWINAWFETGEDEIRKPLTFPTREAAQEYLDDFLCEIDQLAAIGNLDDSDPDHYRVAETRKKWVVWKLADDPFTYGDKAGKHIVVTDDHEDEICGVVPDPAHAPILAAAPDLRDALVLAEAFVAGFEDDEANDVKTLLKTMRDAIAKAGAA
jgi:hypothetical protein